MLAALTGGGGQNRRERERDRRGGGDGGGGGGGGGAGAGGLGRGASEQQQEAFSVFAAFDADGDGFVTLEEMARGMERRKRHNNTMRLSEEDLAQEAAVEALDCFRYADLNRDGKLSFEEFSRWYFSRHRATPERSPGADTRGGFRVRVPGATYCYLHGVAPDGRKIYVAAGSLDEAVSRARKDSFVAYLFEMTLADRPVRVLKRYSSLRSFARSLQRELKTRFPIDFPPKIFFYINVDERRAALEQYFKELLQSPDIRRRQSVVNFFSYTDADTGGGIVRLGEYATLDEATLARHNARMTGAGPHGAAAAAGTGGGGAAAAAAAAGRDLGVGGAANVGGQGALGLAVLEPPYTGTGGDAGANGVAGAGGGGSGGGIFGFITGNGGGSQAGAGGGPARAARASPSVANRQALHRLTSGPWATGSIADDDSSRWEEDSAADSSTILSDAPYAPPEHRLRELGISLPTQRTKMWTRDGHVVTVMVDVPTARPSAAGGARASEPVDAQWEREREVAITAVAQLRDAADGNLAALTVLSLTGTASEQYMATVQGLLRNVLGERGRVMIHGTSLAEMEQMFVVLDKNGDGYVSTQELEEGLGRLGQYLDPEQVAFMVEIADSNGDGQLEYHEFLRMLSSGRNQEAELMAAFQRFDRNGDGCITAAELRATLEEMGQVVTLGEAADIIAQVDTTGDGVLVYREFVQMMSDKEQANIGAFGSGNGSGAGAGATGGAGVSTAGGGGGGAGLVGGAAGAAAGGGGVGGGGNFGAADDPYGGISGFGDGVANGIGSRVGDHVIVTAYVTEDAEQLQFQAFQQGLRRGMRLVKHGRKGKSQKRFTVSKDLRKLRWRKGGLKSATRGVFDLTQVTQVTVSPHNPREFQLRATHGTLTLEAPSPDERSQLVEGFSKLSAKFRSTRSRNSAALPHGLQGKTRDEKCAELVAAFRQLDVDSNGYVGAVELGQAMTRLGVTVRHEDVERIMTTIAQLNGQYDYHQFAWEVAGLDDVGLQSKLERESHILQALQRVDVDATGFLSAVKVGQAIATLPDPVPQDLLRIAQFEADEDGTGNRLNYRKFARIAAGLDEQVVAFVEEERGRRQTDRLTQLRGRRLEFHYNVVVDIFSRYDRTNDGYVTQVDFGQAVGAMGLDFTPEQITSLMSDAQHSRDGRLKYAAIARKIATRIAQAEEGRWENTFRRWDKNMDGLLTVDELVTALTSGGHARSKDEVALLVRNVDKNHDGMLDYVEYVDLMANCAL